MDKNYYGVLKSPEDGRDWKGEKILSKKITLPKKLSYRKNFNKPRDQGSFPTCAAMAASTIKEWQEYKDVFKFNKPYFSPAFIYNHRSNYPNIGMFSRDTMKILQKNGVCLEDDYPHTVNNINNEKNNIPVDTKIKAKNYRIKNYASLSTIEGVKKALKKNGPCYISLPMKNSGNPRFWKKENENDEYTGGGHAVTIVGYDDNKEIYEQKGAFEIRNSSGEDFGDNGYCWFPYSDFGIQWEIWTTIDEISKLPEKNYYIKWVKEYLKRENWMTKYFNKKIRKFFQKNKLYFYIIGGLIIGGILLLILN